MKFTSFFAADDPSLDYVVTHVFFPVKIPEKSDYTFQKDLSFVHAVCIAAHAYDAHIGDALKPRWDSIKKMLDNLQTSLPSERLDKDDVFSQLSCMQTGDVLALFVRAHPGAVVFRKQEGYTLYESFEVSAIKETVANAAGSLTRSYGGGAIRVPNTVFDDVGFRTELASSLSSLDGNYRIANYDCENPGYIPLRFFKTLRIIENPHIFKRVRDDCASTWRRSSLWLLIRVAIQTSFDRSPLGRTSYKVFMLFFICSLAMDVHNRVSSDLLYLMSSKILRRLSKLGSSAPKWLFDVALQTCTRLQDTLNIRTTVIQTRQPSFPRWDPFKLDLARDTQLSLPNGGEYIRNALANSGHNPPAAPLHLKEYHRGTLEDFLSSDPTFFHTAYEADPYVALYDVEQSVEQATDLWIACVTRVDQACTQLAVLMEAYLSGASTYDHKPEYQSIMALTVMELWVALDKLVVKEIPMLSEYSPEVPLSLLESLFLRDATSLYRLARIYQYLLARHSKSRPELSVLSSKFTQDSFAVRYYDSCPDLHHLRGRMKTKRSWMVDEIDGGDRKICFNAKVVVFELQCPVPFYVWRSAVTCLLQRFHPSGNRRTYEEYLNDPSAEIEVKLLSDIPELRSYLAEHLRREPTTYSQLQLSFSCKRYPFDSDLKMDHYTLKKATFPRGSWPAGKSQRSMMSPANKWDLHAINAESNGVLSSQVECPENSSLDEFIALGHVRCSDSSLRWLNILRELHSRALNFRSPDVYALLVERVCEVGPLDVNTGTWVWHQELQDPAFCSVLLNELESLLADVSSASLDEGLMQTVSLLVTRVLAASPPGGVLERALWLLRNVRRKTLKWAQELAYDFMKAPTNKERRQRLHDMATACRSTFDVGGHSILHLKVLRSAEDVEALLSCAFFIRVTAELPTSTWSVYSNDPPFYFLSSGTHDGQPLLNKQDQLFIAAEQPVLRDVILVDPSNQGIDLAVHDIWPGYQPGPQQWELVDHQNSSWLVSTTAMTMGKQSQTVHINLLDGSLLVDGQSLGRLPNEILNHSLYQQIFHDEVLIVIRSCLPGMVFATLCMISDHVVHFALHDHDLVIQVQHKDSDDILQLIPSGKFTGELPSSLVEKHVHWLNLSTSTIEICPLESLWKHSDENWKISGIHGKYHAFKDHEVLIDIESQTWEMVLGLVHGLDHPTNLMVTTSSVNSSPTLQLSISFPYHGLSFFINGDGELESNDFKDMVYDQNQDIGTLYGYEEKVVLQAKNKAEEGLIPRCVLLCDNVDQKTWSCRGTYHIYQVDTELGCLTSNTNWQSLYYLYHLHMYTSLDWSPDRLTGRTGAQEALSIAQSARCQSFMAFYKKHTTNGFDVMAERKLQYPQIAIAETKVTKHLEQGLICCAKRATYLFPLNNTISASSSWQVTLKLLLSKRHPPLLPCLAKLSSSKSDCDDNNHSSALASHTPTLNQLLSSFQIDKGNPLFQELYITHLHASVKHIRGKHQTTCGKKGYTTEKLRKHFRQCREQYRNALYILKKSLGPTDDNLLEQALAQGGQWPPITAYSLLQCLASTSSIKLSQRWKKCLVSFGLLLLELQHAQRLLLFAYKGPEDELCKELENESCDGWSAEQYPDWLLIQLEGHFLIRHIQVDIAMKMIYPPSGESILMQVNMGEGKSSVIIPIVAAALADGSQLVRVIVPKTLSVQMSHLLISRLGGLANRPVYHLPISRHTQVDNSNSCYYNSSGHTADALYKTIHQCMGEHGILLVEPEDVLSLRLANVERQLPGYQHAVQWFNGSLDFDFSKPEPLKARPKPGLLDQAGPDTSLELQPQPSSMLQTYFTQYFLEAMSLTSLKVPRLEDSCLADVLRWLSGSETSNNSVTASGTQQLEGTNNMGFHDNIDASEWVKPQRQFDFPTHEDSHPRNNDNATEWVKLEKWLHSHARDILDESDEILHPRHQLIYTIGHQQHMEGYPDRWTIIQQILRLVKQHASSLSVDLSDSVEYRSCRPGSFPHFRILRTSDAGRRLILLLVRDIMTGSVPTFRFQSIDQMLQGSIRDFISSENVRPDKATEVEEYAKRSQQSNLWSGLLLLRGLFASGILLFALTERRWRVDYGLDHPMARARSTDSTHRDSLFGEHFPKKSKHTRLAVPYRAKDVPAPDTQFGHPDITILLTCLSYYYQGLSSEQLKASFQGLVKEDDPDSEYALWVQEHGDTSLPASLRNLSEFNLGSSEQWDNDILPTFAHNQATIDFFLSRIVFPKEAKEYPFKLAASSWDLAEKRDHPTTGFSGTNDSQYLLPTSITPHELDHQRGADAKVLAYLLQPENDSYMLIANRNGQQAPTLDLLKVVVTQQPEIRVFIDVGAQILDMTNRKLAKEWLNITNAAGAVYFDENDDLMALTRSGTAQPLATSSLSQQLERCVVYLDDAHTRGTDFKFPIGFRAAVTLGPKVTKDRLVQGCMRMRKLGNGHSVMFFAPLEVDQSIRSITHKEGSNLRITAVDVLKWAIHETWTDIQQRAPYWAQQGMSHRTRHDAWSRFCKDEITREQLEDAWLRPEIKSLADLYAPHDDPSTSRSTLDGDIARRCEDLGFGVVMSSIHGAELDEQVERQVNREIEREREVELPPRAEPAEHPLHPDVVHFVKTGTLLVSNAFRPIFTSLEKSSAALSEVGVWSPFLLATTDFCQTVEHIPTCGRMDQYLRPVQWVLSGKKGQNRVLVLVSPFEADLLMADIRMSEYVHLHIYIPRVSERMRPADDLMLYIIPPLPDSWTPPWELIDQLNMFAGQLYLRDWDAYLRLTDFLGIRTKAWEEKKGKSFLYNLFHRVSLKQLEEAHPDSLLPSVMMLLAIRRRGLPFSGTHMGKILQGVPLTERDFSSPQHAAVRDGRTQLSEGSRNMSRSDCNEGVPVSPTRAQCLKRGRLAQVDDASEIEPGRPTKHLRAI